jgi:hypothetical protein
LAAPLTQAEYGLLRSVAAFLCDMVLHSSLGAVFVAGFLASSACARVTPTTHAANAL